jgi:hypothetical protein
MDDSKNDQASPLINKIVDDVYGGRKKDQKFWQRITENPRNEIVGFCKVEKFGLEGITNMGRKKRTTSIVLTGGMFLLFLVFSLVYFRPDFFPFLSYSKIYQTISVFFPNKSSIKSDSTPRAIDDSDEPLKKTKEYTFSDEKINEAKKNVIRNRSIEVRLKEKIDTNSSEFSISKSFEQGEYIYEIEFASGRTVSAESVANVGDQFSFENSSGLLVTVNKNEVTAIRRLPLNFSCRGKVHCSEMRSCKEAMYYQQNCPGTKLDGDADGVPCEDQWCFK